MPVLTYRPFECNDTSQIKSLLGKECDAYILAYAFNLKNKQESGKVGRTHIYGRRDITKPLLSAILSAFIEKYSKKDDGHNHYVEKKLEKIINGAIQHGIANGYFNHKYKAGLQFRD